MSGAVAAGDVVWRILGDDSGLRKSLDRTEKDVQGRFSRMSKSVSTPMMVAGGAITGVFGVAGKSAMNFQDQMHNVATLGVNDLGNLSDGVLDITKEFGLGINETTLGMYNLKSATGADGAEALTMFRQAAVAATAGVTDINTAVQLGTSTVDAFGLGYSQMPLVFDQAFVAVKNGVTTFAELSAAVGKVAPTFAAAGLSTKELYASMSALTKAGITTREASTSLKAAMSNVIKPTEEARQAAEELGVEFNVAALKTQGLEGFLQGLKQATGGNIDKMAQFFGSTEALNAVMALTGNQAGALSKNLQDMENAQGATNQAFKDFTEGNTAFAYRQLKAELTALGIEVGTALLPALMKLGKAATVIAAGFSAVAETQIGQWAIVGVAGLGALSLGIGTTMKVIAPFTAALKLLGIAGTATTAATGGAAVAVGGVGTAATGTAAAAGGAATALGGAGAAAGALGVAAGAAAVALVALGGVAIAAVVAESIKARAAQEELIESKKRLISAEQDYNARLEMRSGMVDFAMMQEMDFAQRTAYRADVEKGAADTSARAWFEHYAGRAESEQEFGQMRNLMLNENISAQEAALVVMGNLTEQQKVRLMQASAEETGALLNEWGIRAQAAADAEADITQVVFASAMDRTNAWINETHTVVDSQRQAAEETRNIWGQAWDWISGLFSSASMPTPPGVPPLDGYRMGGVVGLPGYATGGRIGFDYEAFRWNEAGGEIAVAPVGTRILTHQESVVVAQDAIESAIQKAGVGSGGGGGVVNSIVFNLGNVTINDGTDMDTFLRRTGDELQRRLSDAGISNYA